MGNVLRWPNFGGAPMPGWVAPPPQLAPGPLRPTRPGSNGPRGGGVLVNGCPQMAETHLFQPPSSALIRPGQRPLRANLPDLLVPGPSVHRGPASMPGGCFPPPHRNPILPMS